ncbi:unnamed protein product [Mesocestoides corti]|uniref:Cyclin-like domain-containing protein n=1 Tax=Mesocestoides corti TaxID=53468 RepID=A0A0R3U9K6_MESCO|nr:unnamed protein product [Mesocestoides corti]
MAGCSWEYAGVHLSIDNYVIPIEKLSPTPSNVDGLDAETEFELRYLGCELIQDAGILLKLPQVAMATAQVLYQRYFYSKSFVRYVYEASLSFNKREFLALLDGAYANLKNHIIKAERRVLKELGFCVHGKHPHKLIIMYLKSLSFQENKKFVQTSWNCMNDVLRTDVFVRHTPEAVACACIFLAARRLEIPLPRHPPWWEMFNVDEESVHEIALCLQRLYAREKPNVSVLESRLAELRKKQAEEKEAAAAAAARDAAAAAVVIGKNVTLLSSSNSSLVTNEEHALPDGVKMRGQLSEVSCAKVIRKIESAQEPTKPMSAEENGVCFAVAKDSKGSVYRTLEKRRPNAYSEIESKSSKTHKAHNRSRSPISRSTNSKSRKHRYSSASASYSSGSDESVSPVPATFLRKGPLSHSRRRDRHKKRSRSPYNDGKYRRRHRSRSVSSYSSTSSRSDRSPSKPSSRIKTSPHRNPRADPDKRSSKSTSSKYLNGQSSSKRVTDPSSSCNSKNRGR